MTAIIDVARSIPPTRVPIDVVAEELGVDERQLGVFKRFFDLSHICTAPGASHADLLVAAARGLERLPGSEHRIRYVIGARTVATVATLGENPMHEVADRLGLADAVVFTVTQHACASALLAVDLAGKLLAVDPDPDALALVLTGERAFSPESKMIEGTTVMGEGTAACLVSARDLGDRLLGYATRTLGEYHRVPLPEELATDYGAVYVPMLVEVMREALERAGTAVDELALILPHNVNRVSWRRACRELGFPIDRVLLDNVPEYGHCFGADSFINYVDARARALLAPGDRYLMPSVGLGSTFSAMVFEYQEERR